MNGMERNARCVYCRRRSEQPPWRPFCSERCKLLDLGQWLDGTYRVAGEAIPPDEPADEEPPN